jgi:hypothetical protein
VFTEHLLNGNPLLDIGGEARGPGRVTISGKEILSSDSNDSIKSQRQLEQGTAGRGNGEGN